MSGGLGLNMRKIVNIQWYGQPEMTSDLCYKWTNE